MCYTIFNVFGNSSILEFQFEDNTDNSFKKYFRKSKKAHILMQVLFKAFLRHFHSRSSQSVLRITGNTLC